MIVKSNPAAGVRTLKVSDILPKCEILINKPCYSLSEICKAKEVIDIGCGFGRTKPVVESVGGRWTGVEPFDSPAATVVASAEDLPLDDNSFDVVIIDAVLEHIPDVGKAFSEISRILRPGGYMIGYVAFMECYHEISYSHLSFTALEHYSEINNMELKRVSGGSRFGIDYHLQVLFYPFPVPRALIAACMRGTFKLKSWLGYLSKRRKMSHEVAAQLAADYYKLECLRQSNGYNFVIQRL